MYEEVKDRNEKGYARMVTNYGALNFEVSLRLQDRRSGQTRSKRS